MLWFVFFKSNAQTILGNSNPLPTAALEMQSNSKGFLVPRMSYAQMQAIQQASQLAAQQAVQQYRMQQEM